MSRKNVVPLNSRKLTGILLKQLAAALEIPTSASSEDLRLLISGKLQEDRREPMNVQVVLRKSGEGTTLSLRDVEGEFLEANPLHVEEENARRDGGGDEDSHDDEETSVEALRESLRVVVEVKVVLEAEIETLKVKVESMQIRMNEIWRSSCVQLAEFDAIITAKDEEIALLREELHRDLRPHIS